MLNPSFLLKFKSSMQVVSKLFLFSLLGVLFLQTSALAQSPTDKIYVDRMNVKYLEHLLKEKIDSIRVAHDLTPLANDSILYVAADYHAEYLRPKKKLSHYEKDDKVMETPQLRAEHFGAKDYGVGENIVETRIQMPVEDKFGNVKTNKTYDDAALSMAIAWVNSPGHYKNIITPNYEVTGMAISIDTAKSRVIAVQKFAEVYWKYQFEENEEFFSYSEYNPPPLVSSFDQVDSTLHSDHHVWNLRSPKDEKAEYNSRRVWSFAGEDTKLFFRGKKVGLVTKDLDVMYELLKRNKNGLALEFVTYNPYDCGNPAYYTDTSKRNGQCEFNGIVTKPIYKRKLKRGFRGTKKKWLYRIKNEGKAKSWKMTLGKFPKKQAGLREVNLVIIWKKQVGHIVHFTGACGYDSLKIPLGGPQDGFIVPIPDTSGIVIPAFSDRDLLVTVPFERGKSDFYGENASPVLDSIKAKIERFDSISVRAFSSVEGTEEINFKLQHARAKSLLNVLALGGLDTIPTQTEVLSDWDGLYESLNGSPGFKEIAEWSKEKISAELQRSAFVDSLEPLLAQQRRAEVFIKGRVKWTLPDSLEFIREKYNNGIKGYQETKALVPRSSNLTKWYTCYRLVNQAAGRKYPSLVIPKDQEFAVLREIKFWMDLQNQPPDWENPQEVRKVLDQLRSYCDERNYDTMAYYNWLLLWLKSWNGKADRNKYDKITDIIKDLRAAEDLSPEHKKRLDTLNASFHYQYSRNFAEEDDYPDLVEKSIKELVLFYQPSPALVPETTILPLVKYLQLFRVNQITGFLLDKYGDNDDYREIRKVKAVFDYQHPVETPKTKYPEWLMSQYEYLGKDSWCDLFVRPCGISFQVFDHEKLRDFYCERCGDQKNFGNSPELWDD